MPSNKLKEFFLAVLITVVFTLLTLLPAAALSIFVRRCRHCTAWLFHHAVPLWLCGVPGVCYLRRLCFVSKEFVRCTDNFPSLDFVRTDAGNLL